MPLFQEGNFKRDKEKGDSLRESSIYKARLKLLTVLFCTDTMAHLLLSVVTSIVTALTLAGILK